MRFNDLLHVSCAPIAYFYFVLMNNLLQLLSFAKHFYSYVCETWLFNGGLYQMMLRFQFFVVAY